MKKELVLCILFVSFFLASTGDTAIVTGIYSGIFTDPYPTTSSTVTTGIGTNSITWGTPCDGVTNCYTSPGGITPPSGLTFNAFPFSTEINEPFVLGEIDFFNGTIMPGTDITQIVLSLDGFQITPTQFAGPDIRTISIVNTTNTADPIASADRVTIPMAFFPAANEFGVLESQSATATLLGKFSETSPDFLDLNILGFGESTDPDGFVDGYAPVPLPASFWFLFSGLLGFFGLVRNFFRNL